jgi:hypothetical protein
MSIELAFIQGVRDAAIGGNCPYKRGTLQWHAWLAGFSAYCEEQRNERN